MYELYIEHRPANGKNLLSWDLAHHIFLRSSRNKVIVATDTPIELLSATRRQWLKLMRQVLRERSSTLDCVRGAELSRQVAYMQNLRFSAAKLGDFIEADVTFAKPDELIRTTPICSTAYIASGVEREKIHMLTSWMPRGGVVVIYTFPPETPSKYREEPQNGTNIRAKDKKSHKAALR